MHATDTTLQTTTLQTTTLQTTTLRATMLRATAAVIATLTATFAWGNEFPNVEPTFFSDKSNNERFYDQRTGTSWLVVNTSRTKGLYFVKNENGREKRHKHGVFYSYRSDGTLNEKTTYSMGVKQGPWITYHRNGTVRSDASHTNGDIHGQFTEYNDRGVTVRESTYVKGDRHGKGYKYDRRGKLHFTTDWAKNKPHGLVLQYDTRTGKLIARTRYEHGRRVGKTQWLR